MIPCVVAIHLQRTVVFQNAERCLLPSMMGFYVVLFCLLLLLHLSCVTFLLIFLFVIHFVSQSNLVVLPPYANSLSQTCLQRNEYYPLQVVKYQSFVLYHLELFVSDPCVFWSLFLCTVF